MKSVEKIVEAYHGTMEITTQKGEYHGSISCSFSGSPVSVQIRGACDGADGKYYICFGKGNVDITGENTEGKDGADTRCTLMEIDFEGSRLPESAGDIPNIKGFCVGRRWKGDSAGGEEDSAGQYDFLLYDEKAVYGFNLTDRKKNPGSAGEELFTWMDSDINGYCVTNLYLSEDGRLCATVADWGNEDTAVVMLEKTKADQAPQREELMLAIVDGDSDLAAMAVKFNRGNSRYHLTVNTVMGRHPVMRM